MTARCKVNRLYLASNRGPNAYDERPSDLVKQIEAESNDWIVLEVISKELRIKKMLIKLSSDSKVIDIIKHLKETFRMLNTVDYYVKEVADKQNLDSELNRELHNRMPISRISSRHVMLCKKHYADMPITPPKSSKADHHDYLSDRLHHKKSSQEFPKKPRLMGNELVSVSLEDLQVRGGPQRLQV